MFCNPTLFHQAKSIEKISRKDKYSHIYVRKAFSKIGGPQDTVTH